MTIYKGKIKGNLIINKGDDAKGVTSIGDSLDAWFDATCDFPALTSIGGYPVPDPEIAKARLLAVAQRVVNDPAALDMSCWHNSSHGCGTVHCIAGWAVHLEPGGYDLEGLRRGRAGASRLRAALAARGGKIVWDTPDAN